MNVNTRVPWLPKTVNVLALTDLFTLSSVFAIKVLEDFDPLPSHNINYAYYTHAIKTKVERNKC